MSSSVEQVNGLSPLKQALLALGKMQEKLATMERAKNEPIAIIGLGCRFPGGANNPETFWKLLRDGTDAISGIPPSRWNVDAYYDADPNAPGKMYTRYGGFLNDVDKFDAQFFGISPREAISLDPQQRLLLEVGWEALENACLAPDKLRGSKTGVFIGVMENDYSKLHLKTGDPTKIDAYYVTGNHFSFTAGRLSYVFGFHGPSLALDTACSSSLTAVHLACQSLRYRECNLALAGGVNLLLSPELHITMCKFKALSPDGRCKTFDAAADGFVQSEGCGLVVLKRLSDALADGDNIFALIRGSAVTNDGASGGLTVPNGLAQQAVLRQALANAGVRPQQVSYVEAHGTGTSLGDPIEVRALGAVLGEGRSAANRLLIGSVKTNIGHLDSAAGVAGLIKVVLSLQHGEIPSHLHFKEINPHISLDKIPAAIPTQRVPWPAGKTPRTAGVSAFGLSGTNAHVVLQEAPQIQSAQAQVERPVHLLNLSAKTAEALKELAGRFEKHLSGLSPTSLADVCFSANAGRSHFNHRLAVVGDSAAEMGQKLAAFAAGQESADMLTGCVEGSEPTRVAFLFTGQGAQYVGMGRQLYETQPTFRRILNQCAEVLEPYLEKPLLDIMHPAHLSPNGNFESQSAELDETAYTQPALFALEYALAELWRSWGIEPAAVLGHSVGGYVAACVAGVISLEDGLKLIAERGRLMQSLPKNGLMAMVFADEARVEAAVSSHSESVSIAAFNGSNNIVISGERNAMEAVLRKLQADGVKTQPLKVSHAFHSPLMEPILDSFERTACQMGFTAPQLPLISDLTGQPLKPGEIPDASYWRRHIRCPVRFSAAMEALRQQDHNVFLEVGPNPTLLGMGKMCIPDAQRTAAWLPSLRKNCPDWPQMLESLARLYVRGAEISHTGFERDYACGRRRVVLPNYPFQRQRYWLEETELSAQTGMSAFPKKNLRRPSFHPLLGQPLRSALKEKQFETHFSGDHPVFLSDCRVYGAVVMPSTVYLEMALAAANASFGTTSCQLENVNIEEALILPAVPSETRTVQLILSADGSSKSAFRILSLSDNDSWQLHATGNIRQRQAESETKLVEASLTAVQMRCQEELDVGGYYASLRELGHEYGPCFRGITRLWRRDGEAVGQFRLTDNLLADVDKYHLHPALLDSAFQLLIAALSDDQKTGTASFLPAGVKRLSIYRQCPDRIWGHVLVRPRQTELGDAFAVDVRLFDETGQLVAELEGLTLKRVTRDVLQRIMSPNFNDWLFEVVWEAQELEIPTAIANAKRDRGNWLIFADRGGLGAELAERLRQKGESCVVVVSEKGYTDEKDRPWQINPGCPDDFQRLLNKVSETTPSLRGIIYLWGLDSKEENLASLEIVCGGALHLVQALATRRDVESPRLWLITRDAQPAGPNPTVQNISQAPLWGLGGTIATEHPDLRCVRMDLDLWPETNEIENVFNEIWLGKHETQIAFRGGKRYVARLLRSSVAGYRTKSHLTLPKDRPFLSDGGTFGENGTYLVTGGLRGLGLKVAEWLANSGARHLVLMGRSGAGESALDVLSRLERTGVNVKVARADVSQMAQLAKVVREIDQTMPPLRGIVHSAGVLDDGVLLQQNCDRFARALAPKVDGAWNLHQLSKTKTLDFFVLFSSVASILGTPGQGNYAAGNAFLDALAHCRSSQGLPALSINWGPWSEVGMFAAARDRDQLRLIDQGMIAMSPAQGVQILAKLLEQGPPQVSVLSVNWKKFQQSYPAAKELPLLAHLYREFEKQSDTSPKSRLSSQVPSALTPTERRQLLETSLPDNVARVLRLPKASIGVQQPLRNLGLDSLMALELKNRIETDLSIVIPIAVFLEGPSIAQLTELLLDMLVKADSTQMVSPLNGSGSYIDKSNGNGLSNKDAKQLLSKLDQLSEEEVTLLLSRELFTNEEKQ